MTEITREIDLPAGPDSVWDALTRTSILEDWLAAEVELDVEEGAEGVLRDEDGTERPVVVEEVVDSERLVLRWTRPGLPPSRVSFELVDAVSRTRLVVTETAGPLVPLAALRAAVAALVRA